MVTATKPSALTKEVPFTVTRLFEETLSAKEEVIIHVGGARSSKSYSVLQVLIYYLVTQEHKKIGICRKTFPSLRMTAMTVFLDLLKQYGMYDESKHNKTFNTYQYGTNLVQFFGLDEAGKVRSASFNYLMMEEANDFTYEDYINLKLRMSEPRGPDERNHVYLCLNPIDSTNWIATRASKETGVKVIKSSYKDNPFLSPEYIKSLQDLINQDENFYRVYALGEWGRLSRLIFTNYKIITELPDMKEAKYAYGLDFGLVNASALIKVYLLNGSWYLEERMYQSNLTNSDIIERLSHETRGEIYGDPSSKILIEEIRRAGYDAYEGHKGVNESIDLMKRQPLFITQESTNLIREIRHYQWKPDPNGDGTTSLSEPVKYDDHGVDASRYCIWGMTQRYGFATAMPIASESIRSLHFNRVRQVARTRW